MSDSRIRYVSRGSALRFMALALAGVLLVACFLSAQTKPKLSDAEQAILSKIRTLRSLSDAERRVTTQQLAAAIRDLPPTQTRVSLANALANLSTEGDFGRDTLQAVATTLSTVLAAQPQPDQNGQPAGVYSELASLVRYEHVTTDLSAPPLTAALKQLELDDEARASATWTLTDMAGHTWSRDTLHGKVVLLNFWATWCPPCRKEMPDLEALYSEFKDRGFVVLAVSDEDAAKVTPFVEDHKFTYPILLDPGRKVNEAFRIEGIPKSFVYDRDGKIVAQSIDMRTRAQFLAMLAQAGLRE